MRLLPVLGLLASIALAPLASASPSVPQNGADYVTLAQPQPSHTTGKKVEVIEFFMYHCPVCNALEPQLEDWIRKEGDRIEVRRIHIPYSGASDPEAHLFLTLEALGKSDAIHGKVFNAVHVQHIRLNQDQPIIDWVSKNGKELGIDPTAFLNAWNSFGVQTRLRQLGQVMTNYRVDSAPTLVIDGRYLTTPSLVSQHFQAPTRDELFKATLQVADGLVSKAAQSK